uniref:Serine proteinase stubble n=1 Tax=Haemonchus contortus TaxID=6289 RepID=A0A7I5ECL1_HAECO
MVSTKTLAMMYPFQFVFLIGPSLIEAGFFMQIFEDSGLEVTCPSGNLVYINPISGDLQQCEQQLGTYNESTCPKGTACERFPILVPGFQDFCCQTNGTETAAVEVALSSTKEPPSFSRRGTPDRGVVEAIVERPEPQESDEDEKDLDETTTVKARSRTTTPLPEDEDSSEYDREEVTKRTRRPKNRKPTTTTAATTTTTTKVASHGLPQCNDPSNTVFIDYGNRLRDCYFQRCERGYNCEFNKRIRRYICCGQDLGLVPPPGLPMLPAPKPLNPRRGPRPNPRPYAMQSDGLDDAPSNSQPRHRTRSSCCDYNDCSGERNWEEGCRKQNSRCSNIHDRSSSNCQNRNLKEKSDEHLRELPRQRLRPDWSGSDCNMESNGCSNSRNKGIGEHGNSERRGWVERPPGPPETPRPGCSKNSFSEGCAGSRTGMTRGSSFKKVGNEEEFIRPQRPSEPFGQPTNRRPAIKQSLVNPERGGFISVPEFSSQPFDGFWKATSPPIPQKMNRLSAVEQGRQSSTVDLPHPTTLLTQESRPFMYTKVLPGSRETNSPSASIRYRKQEKLMCATGSEYNLDGLIPSCNSNNSDFCPSSHPHCSFSSSHPHRVCCRHVISQSS